MEYKFTSKERDFESGLDNLGARYNSSTVGRFMSPDFSASPGVLPYSDLANPQSLNLYGYANNNPLNLVDSDGHQAGAIASDWWSAGQALVSTLMVGGEAIIGSGVAAVGLLAAPSVVAVDVGLQVPVEPSGNLMLDALNPPNVFPAVQSENTADNNSASQGQNTQSTGVAPNTNPSRPDKPYKRPKNATTKAQRASVQGKTCTTCGAAGQMYANHRDPLVTEYYRGGGNIDLNKMRSPDAVEPQCPDCSNWSGGLLRAFSNLLRRLFRL